MEIIEERRKAKNIKEKKNERKQESQLANNKRRKNTQKEGWFDRNV